MRKSSRRWNGYSDDERKEILAENERNYRQLVGYIGRDPASADVQAAVARWHDGLRHFYEPTPEMLVGLAQLYTEDARFRAFAVSLVRTSRADAPPTNLCLTAPPPAT